MLGSISDAEDAASLFLQEGETNPMNVALWIAQGLLALGFLWSGGIKVLSYDRYAVIVKKFGTVAAGRELTHFIGIAESAGAIGIVVPMAVNVAPALTPLAAVGLAMIMLLAIGYHIRAHEATLAQSILFLLAAFVALGRFWYGV